MSHISEGVLHAYLDGALDELAGGEAQAVRDHLASCTECAARLDEARAVREEAIAILGGTLPPIEMPPLEDLRARAAVMPRDERPASGRLYRLGWAASIVLAVGAGWMLRGGQAVPIGQMDPLDMRGPETSIEVPRPAEALESRMDDAASDLVGSAVRSPPDRGAEVRERAATPPSDVVAAASPVVEPAAAPPPEPTSVDERVGDVVATAGARRVAEEETMTDASPRAGLRAIAAEEMVVFRDVVDSVAEALRADRPSASQAVRTEGDLVAIAPREEQAPESQPQEAERARRPTVTTAARSVTAGLSLVPSSHSDEDESVEHLGDAPPLVISGLEVLDIVSLGDGVVEGGVRVLQQLEDGEVLELVHLPEGVDPDGLSPFPEDGKTGVITPRDGGWLIMRANRSVEELQRLLERLDGAS